MNDAAATVRRMRDTAGRLRQMATDLDTEAAALDGRLAEGVMVLKGREIVEHLPEVMVVGEQLHYTAMSDRLLDAGYRASGLDPAATLLATVAKDDDYAVTGPRTGIYRRLR